MSLSSHLLTFLILLPTLGAFTVLFLPSKRAARWTTLSFTLATFALSLLLLAFYNFSPTPHYAYAPAGTLQLVQRLNWIPIFHIQYLVGVDGLSLPLILLTTFISILACIASWNIQTMTRGYLCLFLLLESALLGTFCALDFFLFYIFLEISLLPMYFLISLWGGPRRQYAAIKFFLYTLVGSILLLIVLIGLYLFSKTALPGGTFDLIQLAHLARTGQLQSAGLTPTVARALFLCTLIAFLIKLPSIPFHTWLPDAHAEAPAPISMTLSSLLLTTAGYGLFRVAYPLFPAAAKDLWLLVSILAVITILYGALVALAQTDFKRLVAYSSISNMGFVLLGVAMMTPASLNGSLFMMLSHGITSALLFFIVGLLSDRAHHRELPRLGGLASSMPVFTAFSTLALFATLGLPGLSGFIGEILVLLGSFSASRPESLLHASHSAIYTLSILACLGLLLAASYCLYALQRIFLGPPRAEYTSLPDTTSPAELSVLIPLTAMTLLLGILPSLFIFPLTNPAVTALLKLFS